MIEPATERDTEIMREQLGRELRGVVGVAARYGDESPAVVATQPRLPDGSPFPTFYYLTHPELTIAASRIEAAGRMAELAELLESEPVAAAYKRAHEAYIADRDVHGHVEEVAGVSAGGMPTRVKCVHALIGHSLATGRGVNPIGDTALEWMGWDWQKRILVTQEG